MMTRSQLRRVIIDLLLVLVASIIFVAVGSFLSVDKQKQRGQKEYRELFSTVLEADHYGILEHDLIDESKSISRVYLAYGEKDEIVGYIAEVNVTSREGTPLHSYIGIDSDGSTVKGYKMITDDSSGFKEEDFTGLIVGVTGKQMPVALSEEGEEEVIFSEYNPPEGLNDGTYYAQTLVKDNKDYIDYVEIDIKDGRIRRVKWDGINLDPTTGSRNQASLTGAYVNSGENWATQSYNICHALIELQDVSRLAMKSDGKTEIIEGVTTDISAFVNLANECLENSKNRFDKDKYIAALGNVLTTIGIDPESLKDDDGHIVYSFENLDPFRNYNEETGETTYMNVYETTLDSPEDVSKIDDSQVYVKDNDVRVEPGSEDGVAGDYNSSIVSESIDGIPMSEIRTFLLNYSESDEIAEVFCSSINEAYKFFKEYMNWMV